MIFNPTEQEDLTKSGNDATNPENFNFNSDLTNFNPSGLNQTNVSTLNFAEFFFSKKSREIFLARQFKLLFN
jgi:hypothetical protein